MGLHIETGHPVTADVEQVKGQSVRFVTDDGRTMFEIRVGSDGRSLDVCAVEMTKHEGVIYENFLLIQPGGCNSITVRTPLYR